MKTSIIHSMLRTGAVTLMALALAGMPAQLAAQSTNAPATGKKATSEKPDTARSEKKKSGHPFRGKLAKLDKTAKTIQVGQSVYQVTSDTKIAKAGKPATLEDAVEGEQVSGYTKPGDSGKMVATSLNLGSPAVKKASSQGSARSADKKPTTQ